MKLLFNILEKQISSKEIKELLGFVDADLSFKNLLPDIITSTNDVKKLIGATVYDAIHKSYEENLSNGVYTNNYTNMMSNLVRSTRYPIAINAYRLFAPTNDLSHSNDGRRMRNSETEKIAFQWMIDADTKELEKRYYRALDDLIALLDDSKPENYATLSETQQKETIYYKWINSDSHKEIKSLFVNTVVEFNKIFQIESRLLLIKLSSGLKDCERREIIPRITQAKFNLLKETHPTEPTDVHLLELIKEACVFYSIAWAIPRMSVSLFPEGTLQFMVSDRTTTNAKKPAMLNETEYALQSFKESYKRALLDIEELLKPIPETIVTTSTIYRERFIEDVGFSAT